MSLHKVKGLTAKLVIVTGFAAKMIPFVDDGLAPDELIKSMQEQRRLFFVALTRATRFLILSSPKLIRPLEASQMNLDLPYHGPYRVRTAPSPFATQLGPQAPTQATYGDDWLVQLDVP